MTETKTPTKKKTATPKTKPVVSRLLAACKEIMLATKDDTTGKLAEKLVGELTVLATRARVEDSDTSIEKTGVRKETDAN